jgi:hypothetical protein
MPAEIKTSPITETEIFLDCYSLSPANSRMSFDPRAEDTIRNALSRLGHPDAWENLSPEEKEDLINQVSAKLWDSGV